MTDYSPKPGHKFTFGLWTVGNLGRDPFGSAVREPKTPAELVSLLAEVGVKARHTAPRFWRRWEHRHSRMYPPPPKV